MRQIHVVAGVLRDPRGRILLARRTVGRDLAGLWEFPGGKVEAGESPDAALVRELREELGIAATVRRSLIRVPQRYPDKRLVLDVRHVDGHGVPKGLDGQALAWVPPHKLRDYAMPPADRPVVAALLEPDCYLVTPAPGDDDDAWLASLARAIAVGARRVQLRAPGIDAERWATLAQRAVALCREASIEVLVNGEIGLAARLGAGVHLRSAQLGDLGVAEALAPLRAEGLAIAASCHTHEELMRAEALGCAFVVLGPVRPTTTHPGASGIGWDGFAAIREHGSLPIYAIGGLGVEDIEEGRTQGAQGIAAIRGLWTASPG